MFRLYVDEVGNDDLSHVADEAHRYLSLTGVAIHQDHVRDYVAPTLAAIKAKIFTAHDPDDPIILHRKDIMNKKGPFGVLNDPVVCAEFDAEVIRLLTDANYVVITALIDKKAMLSKTYWMQNHPYHYLMEIIVEKYTQLLERLEDTGDIMPERRRGKKDDQLQRAFARIRLFGTRYVSGYRIIQKIPSRHLKFREKKDNVPGLQVCDLIAHPSHQHVRRARDLSIKLGPFATRVIPILRSAKYDRGPYGGIGGFGTKYLP